MIGKMKTLKYETEIDASCKVVWDVMLGPESYKEWVKGFSPASEYRGEWIQGRHIDFIDPNMGGTRALLEKVEPCQEILAKHVAMLDKEGNEDNTGEFVDKWVGTTEHYTFAENEGVTQIRVIMETDEAFEKMFAESWPKALQLLKELCEKSS